MGQAEGKHHRHTTPQQPIHTEDHHSTPIPTLQTPHDWHSQFLISEDTIQFLSTALPSNAHRQKWTLLFSSLKHGKSFNRFCFHVTGHGSTISMTST